MKRGAYYRLAGPEKKVHSSVPKPDWLDLPTHLPNSLVSADSNTSLPSLQLVIPKESNASIDTSQYEPLSHEKLDSKLLIHNDLSTTSQSEKSQPSEPIYIEGTTILLQTDEDIAKWIEERRKNWPTRKNIEAKAQRQGSQAQTQPQAETKLVKQVCRFFAKTGKCKFGNKCKNSHESADPSTKTINGISVKVPQRYKTGVSGGSLFKNLVQRDLFEHENDFVLDFIKHLLSNSLIDLNVMP